MAATKQRNRISSNGDEANHLDLAVPETVPQEQLITLVPINVKEFHVTIRGTSSLIVHKFSNKAKKQIEDKQQKKAKTAKEAREPHAEYLASLYTLPGHEAGEEGAEYGIPAAAFKNAAVSACRFVDGLAMTVARGMFHVLEDRGGLVKVSYETLAMREDTVRLNGPGKPLDLRYRPEFTGWSCKLRVRYNASVCSPEQIVNLLNVAGFSVGLCEWRPERNGSNGMFEVQTTNEQ